MTILKNQAQLVHDTVDDFPTNHENPPATHPPIDAADQKFIRDVELKNFYRAYALYIIGCLASQDVFMFSTKQEGWEDVSYAVRIIAACLQQLPPKGSTEAILPFDW